VFAPIVFIITHMFYLCSAPDALAHCIPSIDYLQVSSLISRCDAGTLPAEPVADLADNMDPAQQVIQRCERPRDGVIRF
jgi:hypothetical protein